MKKAKMMAAIAAAVTALNALCIPAAAVTVPDYGGDWTIVTVIRSSPKSSNTYPTSKAASEASGSRKHISVMQVRNHHSSKVELPASRAFTFSSDSAF